MFAVPQISGGSIACLLNENGDLREDVLQKLHEVCKNELAALLCDAIMVLYHFPLPASLSQLQSLEIEPIPSIGELFK